MKFEVKDTTSKFVKLQNAGDQVAIIYKGIVKTMYGEGIAGIDVETKENVIIPLKATLEKIKNDIVKQGDIIAIKNFGKKRSKNNRTYDDIRYTVYREGIDFTLDEILYNKPPF